MSTFGHPEVYIWAPFSSFFRYFLYLNMPSYHLGIKTFLWNVCGNIDFLSRDESHLRGPVSLKNSWQVTVYMGSLTNKTRSADLPLDDNFTAGNKLFEFWVSTRMYWNSLITNSRYSNQLVYGMRSPKYIIGESWRNLGNSKGRKSYGCGGLVRRLGQRRFSSNSSISDDSCASLKELMEINKDTKHFNTKLIHIISDPEVLILAYEIIKSKPGNSTPGSDSIILDNINLDWFIEAAKILKAGKYKFKPARRVYIPKSGKKNSDKSQDFRPLTISSPRDKIVQQAIYLILNAIYEPSFLDVSHGSRPNRGNHSALEFLKFRFNGVKWCIKADIESNFPSISHKILLNILKKRIGCSKFLALVKDSIKAGFKENKKFYGSNQGLFQGNVTSPILNNIYLHEFDLFMSFLMKFFYKGKQRRKSPIYRKIQYEMGKLGDTKELRTMRRKLWKVDSKDPMDPNFRRLYYVRYVDDFVVGVIGSRKNTLDIQEKIRIFLKNTLKLTLSEKKTFITNFSKKPIKFLGAYIKGTWETEKRVQTIVKNGIRYKVRVTGRVSLYAPIKELFEKATISGFFKKKYSKFVSTKVGWLINLNHADIIRYFNSVIQGNLNYYSFANNRKSLGSFIHGLKWSCARTLALKYKLRFASKIFRKFGSKLKCPETGLELTIPKTFKAIKIFGCNEPLPDDILFKKWRNKLTRSNLFKQCIICGSKEQIEMHHVRQIKDLKRKAKKKLLDFFTMQMAAINRKQVPLCAYHHKALHSDSLSLTERKLFEEGIKKIK
jgi:group II intron reverse transcriptase/maturase